MAIAAMKAGEHDFDRVLFGEVLPLIDGMADLNVTRRVWAIALYSLIAFERAHGRRVYQIGLAERLQCSDNALKTHVRNLERFGLINRTKVGSGMLEIDLADPAVAARLRERLSLPQASPAQNSSRRLASVA